MYVCGETIIYTKLIIIELILYDLAILRGCKKDESEENCIMRSIIIYTVHIRNKIRKDAIGRTCSI
jgi:hypothetical protein